MLNHRTGYLYTPRRWRWRALAWQLIGGVALSVGVWGGIIWMLT